MSIFESKKHKRETLRAEPFEPERLAIIEKRFPYFEKLSAEDRRELLGHTRVFLDEKKFEGCAGLEVTDEIKLTIAAQACLLLLHRQTDYFPACDVILVYPHAYRAKKQSRLGHGIVLEDEQTRLGESHQDGVVVLTWDSVRGGATSDTDGHNVVLHEFAHQLDQEDGAADGVPHLESRAAYGPWAKTLSAEYAELKLEVDEGIQSDIDAYGATDPAEFFAVVTETFFEKPQKLSINHPELYAQLSKFYKQDPLARLGEAALHDHGVVPKKKRAPAEATETKTAENTENVVIADMSGRDDAEKLTRVGPELRAKMHELGFVRSGFVGTFFRENKVAWVGEVMRSKDETNVGVISNINGGNEGLAFWTVLENGTMIETETCEDPTLMMRLTAVMPMHHPREHVFVLSTQKNPAELLETHTARVREIEKREKASVIARDAIPLYLAARLRSTALMSVRAKVFARAGTLAFWILAIATAVGVFAIMFHFADAQAVGQRLALVVAGSLIAGYVVAATFSRPIGHIITWRTFGTPPIPIAELFDRAENVDDSHADEIARAIQEKISGET